MLLGAASTTWPSGAKTCATLPGPIASLKNMRTTAGALLTVEPSTGSEPITKACASATGVRDAVGHQAYTSNMLKLNMKMSRSVRYLRRRTFFLYIYRRSPIYRGTPIYRGCASPEIVQPLLNARKYLSMSYAGQSHEIPCQYPPGVLYYPIYPHRVY